MKHHNIVITIICKGQKTNFCPPYVKKYLLIFMLDMQ